MNTDPIADYLTRIRNGIMAKKKVVDIPASNLKKEMTRILMEKGNILNYKFEEEKNYQGSIKIALKYDAVSGKSAITELQRMSTPGLRKYAGAENLPRILNGLGVSILSTSRGVMTEKEAKRENVGGEVLCYVY